MARGCPHGDPITVGVSIAYTQIRERERYRLTGNGIFGPSSEHDLEAHCRGTLPSFSGKTQGERRKKEQESLGKAGSGGRPNATAASRLVQPVEGSLSACVIGRDQSTSLPGKPCQRRRRPLDYTDGEIPDEVTLFPMESSGGSTGTWFVLTRHRCAGCEGSGAWARVTERRGPKGAGVRQDHRFG